MAGYSGTPLVAKLGMKPGARMTFIGAPDSCRTVVSCASTYHLLWSPPRSGAGSGRFLAYV